MTWKEAEHLDFNPVAMWLLCWWDAYIWWIRELQIAQNNLHNLQGDSGNE